MPYSVIKILKYLKVADKKNAIVITKFELYLKNTKQLIGNPINYE